MPSEAVNLGGDLAKVIECYQGHQQGFLPTPLYHPEEIYTPATVSYSVLCALCLFYTVKFLLPLPKVNSSIQVPQPIT